MSDVRTTAQRLGVPIHVVLRGPWKGKDRPCSYLLAKWGAPALLDWEAVPSLAHFRDGGYGVFCVPPMFEIARYVRKAVKHPEAPTAIAVLARVALFGLDLTDALNLWRWLLSKDPARHGPYRQSEWRDELILATYVLQARWPGGRGLADPHSAIQELYRMRADLAALEIGAGRAAWARSVERARERYGLELDGVV